MDPHWPWLLDHFTLLPQSHLFQRFGFPFRGAALGVGGGLKNNDEDNSSNHFASSLTAEMGAWHGHTRESSCALPLLGLLCHGSPPPPTPPPHFGNLVSLIWVLLSLWKTPTHSPRLHSKFPSFHRASPGLLGRTDVSLLVLMVHEYPPNLYGDGLVFCFLDYISSLPESR